MSKCCPFRTLVAMSRSPFHGIFSFSADQSEAELTPAAATPALPKTQTAAKPKPTGGSIGQIAVDIYEQDGYYIIRAPIAGVKLSDLDIEIDGNDITIRGERKGEAITTGQFYLQECFWGQFSRRVTLPVAIDPKKVRATFSKDNILKVLVPKEEKVKIVRISEGA